MLSKCVSTQTRKKKKKTLLTDLTLRLPAYTHTYNVCEYLTFPDWDLSVNDEKTLAPDESFVAGTDGGGLLGSHETRGTNYIEL